MTIVEIRCPRCGAQCSLKDKTTSEYHCEHCGANFRFMDSTTKTIIQDTRAHHCPICGRPVKIEEAYVCMECRKEYLCPYCVQQLGGKFICKECLRQKWIISEPSQTCPKCNLQLTYIPKYNRWYCYTCSAYITYMCPECGKQETYVPAYQRWYCYNCQKYLEKSYKRITTQPQEKLIIVQPQYIPVQHTSKSGCFIATAAYGTPMCKEIAMLRQFRDRKLNPNSLGKKLIRLYYLVSPPIANVIVRSENMRALVRLSLKPIICSFKSKNYQKFS